MEKGIREKKKNAVQGLTWIVFVEGALWILLNASQIGLARFLGCFFWLLAIVSGLHNCCK
jgi:hypothetical protein